MFDVGHLLVHAVEVPEFNPKYCLIMEYSITYVIVLPLIDYL